jgi:hypothetical protein
MENSVQVILLGIVIISAIGSFFGYLLEPGRFEKRDTAEFGAELPGAQKQSADRSPRLAA